MVKTMVSCQFSLKPIQWSWFLSVFYYEWFGLTGLTINIKSMMNGGRSSHQWLMNSVTWTYWIFLRFYRKNRILNSLMRIPNIYRIVRHPEKNQPIGVLNTPQRTKKDIGISSSKICGSMEWFCWFLPSRYHPTVKLFNFIVFVKTHLWFNSGSICKSVKTLVFTPAGSRAPFGFIWVPCGLWPCWELCTLAVGKLNFCWLVPSRFSLKSTLKLYQIILYIYIYIHIQYTYIPIYS